MSGPFDHTPHTHELAPDDVIRRRVKAELRKRMRGLRATTPGSACDVRSRAIAAAVLGHETIVTARSVALFWPMTDRHEVDLREVDAALRARGTRVYLPRVDSETGTMTFALHEDPASLVVGGFGVSEPPSSAPEAAAGVLDTIVVPAIAVAPSGHRIGYGVGFYDRALPRFAPPARTVAVAFDWQLLAEIPVTAGDVAVEWIVTDARTMRAD